MNSSSFTIFFIFAAIISFGCLSSTGAIFQKKKKFDRSFHMSLKWWVGAFSIQSRHNPRSFGYSQRLEERNWLLLLDGCLLRLHRLPRYRAVNNRKWCSWPRLSLRNYFTVAGQTWPPREGLLHLSSKDHWTFSPVPFPTAKAEVRHHQW